MPNNRAFSTDIRPGRFRVPIASAGKVIIKNPAGLTPLYRFYNSGGETFEINNTLAVKNKSSLDLLVASDVSISATATEVTGMYELISPRAVSRSGRFKEAAGTADSEITIISGVTTPNTMYRIWNPGTADFKILTNSTSGPLEILVISKCSVDVCVVGDLKIRVPTNKEAEGIYESLSHGQSVRSGKFRFQYQPGGMNPKFPQIIELSNCTTRVSIYRVFNASDADIHLHQDANPSGPKFAVLGKKQSVDITLTSASATDVYIRGNTAGAKVKGMFQLVGTND